MGIVIPIRFFPFSLTTAGMLTVLVLIMAGVDISSFWRV